MAEKRERIELNNYRLTIKIADVRVGIEPVHEGFRDFCRDYIIDEEPDFVLAASEADLAEEKERIEEQIEDVEYDGLELEKLWVYRQIAETMPSYDAFLIHATSVRVDEDAYLFLGPSGAGKTTHAKLWEKFFGNRFSIINDDKPIIQVSDERIMVCGSPWCGKENWKNNVAASLKGAIDLNQAEENRIERLSQSDAWNVMMNQVYRSRDAETMKKTLSLLNKVINSKPIFEMDCTEDMRTVEMAYGAMSQVAASSCS